MEAIFAALDSSSQVKILGLCRNNLSSVDPEVQARVVNKKDTVDIYDDYLTKQQTTRIMTQGLPTTNLKTQHVGDTRSGRGSYLTEQKITRIPGCGKLR